MARPSKKTLELRKKIIDLGIFKRDSEIYMSFEEKSLHISNKYTEPYNFCFECSLRTNITGDYINEVSEIVLQLKLDDIMKTDIFQRVQKLSKNLSVYYSELLAKREFHNNIPKTTEYYITHNIELFILKNSLSEERFNYFIENSSSLELTEMINKNEENNNYIKKGLTDSELKRIRSALKNNGYSAYNSLILSVSGDLIDSTLNTNRNKRIYTELDLTKPKEEILEYVSKLKDDFDNDPSQFQNAYELLGGKQEIFSCDIKDCNIYKDTRSLKPISGRLADVLFIYDCKKVNEILGADVLTNEYITDEINKYWQDIKNISTDGFRSIDEYYSIAKDYIDNQRYKDYLSGIQ